MRRIPIDPRPDWKEKVEELGLLFHTEGEQPYWNESAYYAFTEAQIDELETATNELHEMCLAAVRRVIDTDRFDRLAIPPTAVPAILAAYEAQPPSIYGRFDLAYDGVNPPKLLEYNADTPTSLLEAAVVQWHWLQARFPQADQFNSIWEGLVEAWTELRTERRLMGEPVFFAYMDTLEDFMTITALRDTANQARLLTKPILMAEIGWNSETKVFVDMQGYPIKTIFKLYPWEWILQDEFGPHLLESLDRTQWLEPIWKAVLSNKGILAILWEMYPDHPNLLPAYLDGPHGMTDFVRKPLLSREGANVTLQRGEETLTTGGAYGAEGFVTQAYFPLPNLDGHHPVLGSWVIGGEARGMGIRESDGPVTDNLSRFVPHLFE